MIGLSDLSSLSDDELWEVFADFQLSLEYETYACQVLKVQKRVGGGVVPFVLNGPQRLLLWIINHIMEQGRLVRIIILKGRRMGISTFISGLFYQKVSNSKSCYAFQVTHEPQASDFLFKMVKRFYWLSPKEGRPSILRNNARLLEFNNEEGTGLDSAFRVATAGKENIGSGQNINYLHKSEVAMYPGESARNIDNTILPCIPQNPDSMVVDESTANGVGGEFYNHFWRARYRYWVSKLKDDGTPEIQQWINPDADRDNVETSIFFPWFVFEENRMTIPEMILARMKSGALFFEMTDDELKIKKEFNLANEQIYWRRFTIANEFKGDVREFNQSHPDTPDNAFISSGSPYFDNVLVTELKKSAQKPKAKYECQISTGTWIADAEGRLEVWEEPKPGRSYLISADVAEGLVEGDFNSADVFDHRTGDQVATWHGKCGLKEWGQILVFLGRRYNTAYLAPERNNAGVAVVQEIFDAHYPRLHCEMIEEPPNKPRPRYGWHTSEKSRPMILDNLKTEIHLGTHGIKSEGTFSEMLTFQRDKVGKYQAQDGCFDDRVMSAAIGKHLRNVVPIPLPPKPKNIKEGRTLNASGKRGFGGA